MPAPKMTTPANPLRWTALPLVFIGAICLGTWLWLKFGDVALAQCPPERVWYGGTDNDKKCSWPLAVHLVKDICGAAIMAALAVLLCATVAPARKAATACVAAAGVCALALLYLWGGAHALRPAPLVFAVGVAFAMSSWLAARAVYQLARHPYAGPGALAGLRRRTYPLVGEDGARHAPASQGAPGISAPTRSGAPCTAQPRASAADAAHTTPPLQADLRWCALPFVFAGAVVVGAGMWLTAGDPAVAGCTTQGAWPGGEGLRCAAALVAHLLWQMGAACVPGVLAVLLCAAIAPARKFATACTAAALMCAMGLLAVHLGGFFTHPGQGAGLVFSARGLAVAVSPWLAAWWVRRLARHPRR